MDVANERVHDTTKLRPADIFEVEPPGVQPLQSTGASQGLSAEEQRVCRDAFVSFHANRYAVLWKHGGRYVRVTATPTLAEIRDENGLRCQPAEGLVSGLTLPRPGQYHGAPCATRFGTARRWRSRCTAQTRRSGPWPPTTRSPGVARDRAGRQPGSGQTERDPLCRFPHHPLETELRVHTRRDHDTCTQHARLCFKKTL